MKSIKITTAREKIYTLIDETVTTHEPIQITSKNGNAILISESDWESMQETMYLLNIKGMRESIIEGMDTPIDECIKEEELEW